MIVTVKLFAAARQVAGREAIEIELSDTAVIADVRSEMAKRIPELAFLIGPSRFAVNAEYVTEATKIRATDEIALIPPVSGG
jgi:molybdopterin converting factor subunit 1